MDSVTQKENIALKDFSVAHDYLVGEDNIQHFDLIYTYDFDGVRRRGLTWSYFNEKFTNLDTHREVPADQRTLMIKWEFNFKNTITYSEFRPFFVAF